VSRTIADLRGDDTDRVTEDDVALALRFRATLAAALRNGRAA
jgi:predicted ATPase with chaperone activity